MNVSLGVMFRCTRAAEDLVPMAVAMEAAGADEFWVVEDCFYGAGIATAATALAATSRMGVGLGIVPAVARNAAFTAMEFATLACLYPQRFHGGIGHGVGAWMRQIGAFPSSQLAALEEVALAVRQLLAGELVTIHGEHVHLDAVKLNHPPSTVPLVSLGVRGPKSLAVSGYAADGTILAEASSPAYVTAARAHINAVRPHRITVFAWAVPDIEAGRMAVASVMADPLNDAHWEPLGITADVVAWRKDGAGVGAIPERWVREHAVIGDGPQLIEALATAGAHSVVLVPHGYGDAEMAHIVGALRRSHP